MKLAISTISKHPNLPIISVLTPSTSLLSQLSDTFRLLPPLLRPLPIRLRSSIPTVLKLSFRPIRPGRSTSLRLPLPLFFPALLFPHLSIPVSLSPFSSHSLAVFPSFLCLVFALHSQALSPLSMVKIIFGLEVGLRVRLGSGLGT